MHHVSKFSIFRATRARVHLIQLNLSKWNNGIKATAKVFIKTADRRQDTSPEDSLWWVAHNVPSQASRTTKKQTRKKHVEWLFLLFCWKLRPRLQNDRYFFFSFTTAAFYFAVFFFCLCEFSDRGLPAKTTKKLKPFKTFLAIRKRKRFVKKARNGKRIKSS